MTLDTNIPLDPHRTGPEGEVPHLLGQPDSSLLCLEGNEIAARLLGESIPMADHHKLIQLSKPVLKAATEELAQMASDSTQERARSAESWAAEFLHLSMEDVEAYFLRAFSNAYSRKGHVYKALVRAAAAYAWVLRQNEPEYAVPGSMRASMRHLTQEQQETYLANSSRYQAHSFDIEDEKVRAADIQTALQALIPSHA